MCEVAVHTIVRNQSHKLNINAYDPTRTITLRNAFAADLKRRFVALKKDVVEAIVTDDAFDLIQPKIVTFASPGPKAFQFSTSQQKVEEFMAWFTGQVDKRVLEVTTLNQIGTPINAAWTNKYIADSYKRGVIRARYEMTKAQFGTPSIADTGGIVVSMSAQEAEMLLEMLIDYLRLNKDLKIIELTELSSTGLNLDSKYLRFLITTEFKCSWCDNLVQ